MCLKKINFISVLLLLLSIGINFNAIAMESQTQQNMIAGQQFESSQYYQPYIESRSYPQVTLDSSFGKLVYESEIVNYKPEKLYNYYKNFVCDGIYGYNCTRNIENLKQYAGLDINSESGLIYSQFINIPI